MKQPVAADLDEAQKEAAYQEHRVRLQKEMHLKQFEDALMKCRELMMSRGNETEFLLEMDLALYTEEMFSIIKKCLSTPRFILFFEISQEEFVVRYKKTNGVDEIEETEKPKIMADYNRCLVVKQFLIDQSKETDFLDFLEFNNCVTLAKAKENILSVFQKDFILVIDRLNNTEYLKNTGTQRKGSYNLLFLIVYIYMY